MGKVCLEEVPGQIWDLLEMLCLCAVSGTSQRFPSRAGGRGRGGLGVALGTWIRMSSRR